MSLLDRVKTALSKVATPTVDKGPVLGLGKTTRESLKNDGVTDAGYLDSVSKARKDAYGLTMSPDKTADLNADLRSKITNHNVKGISEVKRLLRAQGIQHPTEEQYTTKRDELVNNPAIQRTVGGKGVAEAIYPDIRKPDNTTIKLNNDPDQAQKLLDSVAKTGSTGISSMAFSKVTKKVMIRNFQTKAESVDEYDKIQKYILNMHESDTVKNVMNKDGIKVKFDCCNNVFKPEDENSITYGNFLEAYKLVDGKLGAIVAKLIDKVHENVGDQAKIDVAEFTYIGKDLFEIILEVADLTCTIKYNSSKDDLYDFK